MAVAISSLDRVRHACMVPESDEHVREVTAAWIASGLRAGDRVVYLEDDVAGQLLERLEDDRVPAERAIAEGQLALMPPRRPTRRTVPAPLRRVEQTMNRAIAETADLGWPGLRFIARPARTCAGVDLNTLVGYEEVVERVLGAHRDIRLLCLYDRGVSDQSAIAAIRRVHRTEVVHEALYDDGLLRVTRPGPGVVRLAGEIDYSNRAVPRDVLARALAEVPRSPDLPADVTVDLASLRFLDVTAAVELIHVGRECPTGHHLVLAGVRAHVARLLDRCGAPLSDQLVVQPRRPPD
ncbi:MAG TPA: MEDS domain-containing protein [Pseudonocardia sp.]|jgi:anti-anti-sigma regulatory factor